MWKSMTKNKSDYFSEDTVFVQARGVSALYGQHNEVYSTFSGFMVIPNIGRTGVVTTPPPMGNIIGWMSTIYTLCWMLLNVLQSYLFVCMFPSKVHILQHTRKRTDPACNLAWGRVCVVVPIDGYGTCNPFKSFNNNCYFQRIWYTFKVVELILCTGPAMKYIPHFPGF